MRMNLSTHERDQSRGEVGPRRSALQSPVVAVIDSVLDPKTCAALIAQIPTLDDQRWLSSTAEFDRSILHRPGPRAPQRAMEPDLPCRLLSADARPKFTPIEDPTLALRIFYRLADVLPESIRDAQLAGLKPLLRGHRFGPGEGTHLHRDPIRECAEAQRSALSLTLFLNDDFGGGSLEFPEHGEVVAPKTGRAVFFSHDLLHRDRPVDYGERFVLEGEVFYSDLWRPYRG